MDLYLRSADKDTMDAALLAAGLIGKDLLALGPRIGVSRIGPVVKITGYDANGPVTVVNSLYHANVRMRDDPTKAQLAALAGALITAPVTPYRMWEN